MGTLNMSAKELKRVEILALVKNQGLKLSKAAELLSLSYRQAKRMWRRYREQGSAGLAHRGRGQAGNRRLAASLRKRVLSVVSSKYADYGSTLAAECLAEEDGLKVCAGTLRRWRMEAGVWKSRAAGVYRMRRERRSCFGQMVQMDGSHHAWLEDRGPWCVLMVAIDDATNETFARFYEGETMFAAMDCFGRYAKRYGVPHELYVDRDGIYRSDRMPTAKEALAGSGPLTQFGRAMKQLSVKLIMAGSPQAKGRVERRHGVFQDRLVKALRRRKISSIHGANAYLEKVFLKELNARFTVKAASAVNVHRKCPRDLDAIFCVIEQRQVSGDWCVLYDNRVFQLLKREQRLALAKRKVEVREQFDGGIMIVYQGRKLAWRERHRAGELKHFSGGGGGCSPPSSPRRRLCQATPGKKGPFLRN